MARTIGTILAMRDRTSKTLMRVNKNVENVTKNMKKSQRQVQKWQNNFVKGMDKVTKKVTKVGLAVGAMLGVFATKVGFEGLKDLEEGAAKVKSIAKNALQLKNIKKDLLKASTKTGVGVTELAETQYSAISSGVSPKDSLKASVTASKLAKAGFTDANSALKVMTSTMNVYGLKGQEAMQKISDKLLVTQNLGVTTVAELSESMGSLTPIANSAGASIDELMAGMASLTKNGLKTDEAVTAFKGVLTSVIKPSDEAAKMAKKLGIDFSVSAIKSKGFSKFLEEIKEKTGGNTELMGQLFGNVRALSGALVLTGKGFKDFNTSLDAMKNSAGATDEAYKTMTNTIGFKLNKLKNTSKNIFTSIMNTQSGLIGQYIDKINNWVNNNEKTIQEWVRSIGDGIVKITKFIRTIVKFAKKHEKLITTLLVFIGTLYTVIKVIGILKTVFTALNTIWLIFNGTLALTPLGWIVLAVGAVITIGYALWRNWDKLTKKARDLWASIKETFNNIKAKVVEVGNALWSGFGDRFPLLQEFIGTHIKSIKQIFSGIIEFVTGVFTGNWKKAWEGVKGIFTGIFNGLQNAFLFPLKAIIKGINYMITQVNGMSIDIPEWVPKIGGQKFGFSIPIIPDLPEFAKGGIATQPSIFGEAGPEIAIPLKHSNRSRKLLNQATRIINPKEKANSTVNNIKNTVKNIFNTIKNITNNISNSTNNNTFDNTKSIANSTVNNIKNSNVSKKNNDKKTNDVKVYVTIQGNVIGNNEFIDKVGERIVKKVKLALDTM
ncbi:phage-related minor tail protein [Clostridium tepidiprofundi DSM 19306]|uniref:Phage-related minor tail protein n=1 Tax=Clostridium tepidiprofundi DSM 19306 TaxID=1121338 RepID=A0A151B7R8_9CLOT|nr:phage tail tape measure protein [Clostridium tepidiprofundi]KYH35830.1 phage-related minor tail protein [Clostridium tepidiprofundi DSM 19306]